MAKKIYSVGNLSYRDTDIVANYNFERVAGKSKFYFPIEFNETSTMCPGELTELICLDTLKELENDQYTKHEINNKIQDLLIDVEEYSKDKIVTSDEHTINKNTVNQLDGENNLFFDSINVE